MKILHVDAERPDARAIREAADLVRRGGLVALPTETVYGLGANALDADAVERIFAAKGRPPNNPLIVHCADRESARSLSAAWPPAADLLATAYWPGPLTLVVRKAIVVPDVVTAGLDTVALRVPEHPVARSFLEEAGIPIAAPSANRSSEISPTTAEHVRKSLAGRLDLLLDGGETPIGIESTVVDVSRPVPVLLRPGSIDPTELEHLLGGPIETSGTYSEGEARPGPGMLDRHYAPRARLILLPPDAGGMLAEQAALWSADGASVGALLLEGEATEEIQHPVRMPLDAASYAHLLYARLHDLDDAGCDVILVEGVPNEPPWAGVRDRLKRAATPA